MVRSPVDPRSVSAWIVGARRGPREQAALARAVRGRVVCITGASDGIGAEVARDCGAAGAHVLLVARRAELLSAVADEIREGGGHATPYPADLSDLDDVARVGAQMLEDHGRVDVLVNNAGRSIRRSVADSIERFHDIQRVMQLNFFGATRLTLALLPAMLDNGDGHIVQVSTIGTFGHVPRFSAYLASKAALEEYGRVMAHELGDQGINVSIVHLPLVRTAMIAPTKRYDESNAFTPRQGAAFINRAIATRTLTVDLGTRHTLGMLDRMAPQVLDRAWNEARRMRRRRSQSSGRDPRSPR